MFKHVLALEGGDGSGKGAVCQLIRDYCRERSIPFHAIGRSGPEVVENVGSITELLQSLLLRRGREELLADVHLRIARDYVRAAMVERIAEGIVVLDRFVLSVRSRLGEAGICSPAADAAFADLVDRLPLRATAYCECAFDIAWSRVVTRAEESGYSPKEKRGMDFNRRLTTVLESEFREGRFTRDRWSIRTDIDIARTRAILTTYLDGLPGLERCER